MKKLLAILMGAALISPAALLTAGCQGEAEQGLENVGEGIDDAADSVQDQF